MPSRFANVGVDVTGLWAAVVLALIPGVGNFLGAMAAEVRAASPRVLKRTLHAAAGVVIAIVAVELVPIATGRDSDDAPRSAG